MDSSYAPQNPPFVIPAEKFGRFAPEDGKRWPGADRIIAILSGLDGAKLTEAGIALLQEAGSTHSDENRPCARLALDDATLLANMIGWVKSNLYFPPAPRRCGVGGYAVASDNYSSTTAIRALCNP